MPGIEHPNPPPMLEWFHDESEIEKWLECKSDGMLCIIVLDGGDSGYKVVWESQVIERKFKELRDAQLVAALLERG